MKATRVILLGVILAALMVPLAYAINFIGAVNFVASHGGNVTFAQNFQAYSLTYPDGLNRFSNMVWRGTNYGNLGFDVAAGANMTVTSITRNTVRYTVTGATTTYVYAHGRGPPTGSTGTTTLNYGAGSEITTVTSGTGTIVITWEPETYKLFNGVALGLGIFAMIPLVFAAFYVYSLMKSGEPMDMSQMIFVVVMVVTSFLIIGALLRLYI